LGRNLIV